MGKNEEKIAIYSRKSRFTGKGESIGNQIELCKSYVAGMFGEKYAEECEIFEDEGFSGGNLKRPDFQKMMEQVRRRRFRAIVVYRLDRISRMSLPSWMCRSSPFGSNSTREPPWEEL